MSNAFLSKMLKGFITGKLKANLGRSRPESIRLSAPHPADLEKLLCLGTGSPPADPIIEKLHCLDLESPAAWAFDPDFYMARYPDLTSLGTPEASSRHYEKRGRREGRVGSPAEFLKRLSVSPQSVPRDFSPEAYLLLNPDLQPLRQRGRLELLAHY